MLNFGDNTGEKDELDPVLEDDETLQDAESENFDEEFDDDGSGQNDFDYADVDKDDEGDDSSDDGEGNNTENGNNTGNASEEAELQGQTQSEDLDSPSAKKTLTKEENAANAARRRQDALEAKVKEEHTKTVLEVLGGTNPYTKKEMNDAHDVEVYERMRRIEKAGGDPVADYASTLAEEKRQAEKANEKMKTADFDSWAKQDGQEFAKANPDVNIGELFKNETFAIIAEPLLQRRVPMSEIYKIFQKTQSNIDSANQKAKKQIKEAIAGGIANNQASAGSLKSNGDATGALFTIEQIKAMSPSEMDKNWDKVERSLEKIYAKK